MKIVTNFDVVVLLITNNLPREAIAHFCQKLSTENAMARLMNVETMMFMKTSE